MCLKLFQPQKPPITDALVPEEVTALIRYASERGLDPQDGLLGPLNDAVNKYVAESEPAAKQQAASATLHIYSQLTKLTFPVNGRTLIDTEAFRLRYLSGLSAYTIIFFTLALGNIILNNWLGDIVIPEEGRLRCLYNFYAYILDPLSPFIWGGLGSCVYLLKSLSDYAGDRSFDKCKLHGWHTRVWLGAILGAVMDRIFTRTGIAEEHLNLGADAIAFLTGVGVKAVYGAIDKAIDQLANMLNLKAIRASTPPTTTQPASPKDTPPPDKPPAKKPDDTGKKG